MGRHFSLQMALARRPPPAPGRGHRSGGGSPLTTRYPAHRINVPLTHTRDHNSPTTRVPFAETRQPSRPHKPFNYGLRDAAIAALMPQYLHQTVSIAIPFATVAWRHPVTTRYGRITVTSVHRPEILPADGPSHHLRLFTHCRPAAGYLINRWAEDTTSLDLSLVEARAAEAAEAASSAKAAVVAAVAAPPLLLLRLSPDRNRLPATLDRRIPFTHLAARPVQPGPSLHLLHPNLRIVALPQQQPLTASADHAATRCTTPAFSLTADSPTTFRTVATCHPPTADILGQLQLPRPFTATA